MSTRAPEQEGTAADPPPFDVCGPLPEGTTVLEASAGTGKTYTIAALAARYVAQGEVELSQLMMVTFGRMATDELRQRVRERLAESERLLGLVVSGRPVSTEDEVSRWLLAADSAELLLRHGRVRRALADFDAATIATTHQFCSQMLAGLGVLGEQEPDALFTESLADLVSEVATDCYLRRFADRPEVMDYPAALALARRITDTGHTRLVPDADLVPPPQDGQLEFWRERVNFAREVRAETSRRARRLHLVTYDDLLIRLQNALHDPVHGPTAAARLRSRYAVVLVDEFQDTDPVQWDILRTAFAGHRVLILIGDPKQAIYAFRGADVASYLAAVREADHVFTLAVNRRSDAGLVAAVDTVLAGAALGSAEIVARPVAAHHLRPRGNVPPFRLRVIGHDPDRRLPRVDPQRAVVLADLVADVGCSLRSGPSFRLDGSSRPLQPSDIAVLVRSNRTGEAVRDALVAAGVPAVMIGAESVFASATAGEWLTLLRALERPRQALIRQAALTRFVGYRLQDLADADEHTVTRLTQLVRSWARVTAQHGVAALVEAVTSQTGLPARMLAEQGGERRLTDLRHIGQLLHAVGLRDQLGIGGLVEWLRDRMSEAAVGTSGDRARRLETEAQSVSVITVHRSKGLEYPVVYLPELWNRWVRSDDDGSALELHEDGGCVLDVGGLGSPGRAGRFASHQDEEAGEDLRLAYVALTRAQCQVVAWWAPSTTTPDASLHRLLFGPRSPGVSPPPQAVTGTPATLAHLAPTVTVELVDSAAALPDVSARPAVLGASPVPPDQLRVRTFRRALDLSWRRTSYSALTAAAHGLDTGQAGVSSETPVSHEDDELATATPPSTAPGPDRPGGRSQPGPEPDLLISPMSGLPAGAQFGSAVHAVLERLDTDTPDLRDAVRTAVGAELARLPVGDLTVGGLAEALLPALQTPLGPLVDDLTLSGLTRADRLTELDFELPLLGGDRARSREVPLTLAEVAALLRRHLGPDDPLAGYPDHLDHPLLAGQPLRGYLTGSIDAVLRVGPPERRRFLVVDYKTNQLGGFEGGPVTLAAYRPDRLADAMVGAHYPLQALLYSVALHRFLRWRQPGYDPQLHLGGVLYLFLRGMAGPTPPRLDGVPYGVFSWSPSAALVTDLSALLADGGRQ